MSAPHPDFEFVHDDQTGSTLLAGFSEFGLAGLTAVDYLVDQLGFTQSGHVRTRGIPSVTPFEDGTPRHHSRLFDSPDGEVTVLVSELFVPVQPAQQYARTMYDWVETTDIEEVTVLSGVPIAHGPEEHRPFYISTTDYSEDRLDEVDIDPMGRGYLDGINGATMTEAMDRGLPTGILTTPAHAQTPDIEAALRLLDALERAYGFDIDTGPLESFAAEIQQYYQELSARIEEASKNSVPEDRMYM